MQWVRYTSRTKAISGAGTIEHLGALARGLQIRRALIVADRGILGAGYVETARVLLEQAGVTAHAFHDFTENPDSAMVEAGRIVAAGQAVDGIIGLGGGSSLDCAKGINFVLSNGGTMADYRGYGKAARPMLPMIGIPTTAGTGSDAQSYALISDPATHAKMACGDPKAAFQIVILDPALTVTQPAHVTAAAGYDAISHAVEAAVTRKRNSDSFALAQQAWTLLGGAFERVMVAPRDLEAREAMLLGAHVAGAAVELSMLGAAHACANPLTARYGTTHGVAIALLLRHVVRWNLQADGDSTPDRQRLASYYTTLAPDLVTRLGRLASAGHFPSGLAEAGVSRDDLEELAIDAGGQWTGTFNPRAFDAVGAREIYEMAW